jgi:outer membrane lipoprotein SlyB
MNTNVPSEFERRSRIHPLVAAAAVGVILVSATGIAAMTGVLPVSRAVSAPPPEQAASAVSQALQNVPAASATPASAQPYTPPSTQPYAQQGGTRSEPASEPPVHRRHVAPVPAPTYSSNDGYSDAPRSTTPRHTAIDPNAGEVVAVNAVQAPEPSTGIGAVGGAIAGGLLGNQIGAGRGRVLATIAGAVGGGLAGNGIEHAVRKDTTYQVQVRMQDGSYRNFTYQSPPPFEVGEQVRAVGDTLAAS